MSYLAECPLPGTIALTWGLGAGAQHTHSATMHSTSFPVHFALSTGAKWSRGLASRLSPHWPYLQGRADHHPAPGADHC